MKKYFLIACLLAQFSYWASAQVVQKRLIATTNRQATIPLAGVPATLVFTYAERGYQWGILKSESDTSIAVNFIEGWGNCVIGKNGKVTFSNGLLQVNEQFERIEIMEGKFRLEQPSSLLQEYLVARLAFSVNNKPHTYAAYTGTYNQEDNSISVMPIGAGNSKYLKLYTNQKQWLVGSSNVAGFTTGDKVSAVYAYTHKRIRTFYLKQL